MIVTRYTGWRRFLTLVYWRFWLVSLARGLWGTPPFEILETFKVELPPDSGGNQ